MNWREFVTDAYRAGPPQPRIAKKPEFYPGASTQQLSDAELRLGATFPVSLRLLLLESNGVMDMMAIDGGDWFNDKWLLWPVAEIVDQNLWYRSEGTDTYERDFCKLVFFADAGSDGILFGFPVTPDSVCEHSIVVWHPIEDELADIAPSLEEFLKRWLTSTIWV